jgi:hypothetical protein
MGRPGRSLPLRQTLSGCAPFLAQTRGHTATTRLRHSAAYTTSTTMEEYGFRHGSERTASRNGRSEGMPASSSAAIYSSTKRRCDVARRPTAGRPRPYLRFLGSSRAPRAPGSAPGNRPRSHRLRVIPRLVLVGEITLRRDGPHHGCIIGLAFSTQSSARTRVPSGEHPGIPVNVSRECPPKSIRSRRVGHTAQRRR